MTREFESMYEYLMEMWSDDDLEPDNLFAASDVRTGFRRLQIAHDEEIFDKDKIIAEFIQESIEDAHIIDHLNFEKGAKDKRIAELKSQLPKVIVPKKEIHNTFCDCGCLVGYSDRYCCQCGSKLNLEDSE